MAGTQNLKNQVKLLESLTEVLLAAKADDGKVSLSDLLDKDVWAKGLDLAFLSKELTDDFSLLKEELQDLNSMEAIDVLTTYLDSFEKLWDALNA